MVKLNQFKKYIVQMPLVKEVRGAFFEVKLRRAIKIVKRSNDICIFFMSTPCHGNLGDQAIVYAQYEMFKKLGLKDKIVEISNSDYVRNKHIIKKYIDDKDMIVIDGGGNLGTLWPDEDDKIGEIINTYYRNKIIIFPQTCYYEEGKEGRERLNKNKQIYLKNKNLMLCLRDKKSYEFCKDKFPQLKTIYVPDIVLSISELMFEVAREGCLLCFRNDLEKMVSNKDIKNLQDYLKGINIPYKNTSTLVDMKVDIHNREKVLMDKWKEFASAKLIITDRLHGMVFAAITGTPCLALDNKSKKVSGVYKWISNQKYIKICSDLNEVKESIKDMCSMEENVYTGYKLEEFKKLMKVILNE